MINDNDADFFEYSTFDYAYGDEAEEFEKKFMLSKFAQQLEEKGMKRVSENPDVYIYITQDISRNIETVYHPAVTSDTYSNSNAGARSSWVGSNFISYNSSGHSSTVTRESGKIGSHQMNDVYMQVSILDAKKVNSKAVPKIWQFKADQRFDVVVTEKLFENFAEVGGMNYPFGTDGKGIGIVYRRQLRNTGMFSESPLSSIFTSKAKLSSVLPGSWAESYSIKKGSKLWFQTVRHNASDHNLDRYDWYKPWLSDAYRLCKGLIELFDSRNLRKMPETPTCYIDQANL